MNYYYITGTSRGIGFELTSLLLEQSDNFVVGIGRTNTINHQNYKHIQSDLTDVQKTIDFKFEEHPDANKIVLINNAGMLGDVRHTGKVENKSIIDTYTINIVSPSILINNFIQTYREFAGRKIILNVSSGAASSPIDGWSSYCASKSALDMYSKVVAEEQNQLEGGGTQILSIAPGKVDTRMQEEIRKVDVEGFSRLEYFKSCKHNGDLSSPKDVARKYISILEEPFRVRNVVSSIND